MLSVMATTKVIDRYDKCAPIPRYWIEEKENIDFKFFIVINISEKSGMSKTQIFGKMAPLESRFVQHTFCLVPFKWVRVN